jgi:hypothetical protein
VLSFSVIGVGSSAIGGVGHTTGIEKQETFKERRWNASSWGTVIILTQIKRCFCVNQMEQAKSKPGVSVYV